ncbi:MAG: lipid A biosynthesis acyltransferase [Pseudomonadota bacterium]|nr:lipid A biosynthesis acyltransferase [Pseudomonadota bacterium]
MLNQPLAYLGLGFVWLLHWLPLPVLAVMSSGLGRAMYRFGASRRRVALRNVELCLPALSEAERRALVRQHFLWLARSYLDRSLLWFAGRDRLTRLIHVEGDVHLAERSDRSVMWLVPHFLAVDVAGIAAQLFQTNVGCNIYTAQRNPVFDRALRRGRQRFGLVQMFTRAQGAVGMVRAIKRGAAFFNPCDMDFGIREAAFVPFFGQPAATLLAPSKLARSLNMIVQPVLTEILPGGQGWKVTFMPPWADWPTDDAEADMARMNHYIEQQILKLPAQYLWVHRRFKTRPPGLPPVYD